MEEFPVKLCPPAQVFPTGEIDFEHLMMSCASAVTHSMPACIGVTHLMNCANNPSFRLAFGRGGVI